MLHHHHDEQGRHSIDQPFETNSGTVLPCGHQPPHPVGSDIGQILTARNSGSVPYPNGDVWVQTPGAPDVTPGILGTNTRWSANPVTKLNPLLSANSARPVSHEVIAV